MKRYAILVVVVLAVLAVTWSAFAQAQFGETWGEQMRARSGGVRRGIFMNAEDQQKAIKTIEAQLAKFKASVALMPAWPQGGFEDLSEKERKMLRMRMLVVFQTWQSTLRAITSQVAALQGRRQPEAEGARFMIINTNDLKPIQEAATKEKAEKTAILLQRLIGRGAGRSFGDGGPGSGERPQGGGGQKRGGQ